MERDTKNILSICIATYNRSAYLKDLIKKILICRKQNFNICITDNCSTDDTELYCKGLNNPRVLYFRNSKNIGGGKNIIQSIFNSTSQYAYYLNDRDTIDIDKLEKLIVFLEENTELSFVDIDGYYDIYGKTNSENYVIYEKGYESLYYQHVSTHPSELLFNASILKKYYHPEDFFVYSELVYAYDFMAREMMCHGDTAHFELGLWKERIGFKKKNKSGYMKPNQKCFFDPDFYLEIISESLKHTNKLCNTLGVSDELIIQLYRKLFSEYEWTEIFRYKKYMMSDDECNHYGINKRYIGIIKLVNIMIKYEKWFNDWIASNCGYQYSFKEKLLYKFNVFISIFKYSIKEDVKHLIKYE